ncbi:hypothetical protein TL16_g09719 [Triparma laevis f. inornata]|uniref:Uncharacterized protein n=1 Tax=Triparma laevis f. inornata TaxID=1714386 RepID=A0A9W7B9B5_9STRA|nr:hypothetical protein TL16_g09719 [Triparma laevis f. inornata]
MKYQHLHDDSVANTTWKNVDVPDKMTKEVTEIDIGCDYVDGVDKIAIPPGFIKVKKEEGMRSKEEIKMKFPDRVVIQPTITLKKGNKIERVEGDFLIRAIDYQERLSKTVKVIRPASAPIRNIKKSQKVARDALSTPSRFVRLGSQYVDKDHEWMTQKFEGKRVFRMVKQLPGEALCSNRIVDAEYLTYNRQDPELYEWCVETGDETNIKKLKYNPDGTLKLKPPKYYKRAVLEPGFDDLLGYERAEYCEEKFAQLSIPKKRWDENILTEYFRNQSDELVKTVVKRDKGRGKLKHRAEVVEEIEEVKERKGVKLQSQYSINAEGRFKSYSEARRAGY